MVIYFSGTGNSRYAAAMAADKLNDSIVDAGGYIRTQKSAGRKATAVFRSETPWVFAAPAYAWRMPKVFEQFISTSEFNGSRDAYFIITCGSEIGAAEKSLRELCASKNLNFKGVMPVAMPNNYIIMSDAPSVEEAAAVIEAARPVLENAIGMISAGEAFPAVKTGGTDGLKSGIVNSLFYSMYIKSSKFHVSEACTGCGTCAKVCPMNNISLQAGKPVWSSSCTHCMACISSCPSEAVEYGTKTAGRRRYRCEKYNG